MNSLELILLGLALSADAVAVSMTNGLRCYKINYKILIFVSSCFAFFQALMPALGYLSSFVLTDFIHDLGRVIAFVLLEFIGIKMAYSSFKKDKNLYISFKLTKKLIITQAIATSIDALAVGVSFAALDVPLIKALPIIFILTFVCTFLAAFLGIKLIKLFKLKAELLGGAVLILIGFKILI